MSDEIGPFGDAEFPDLPITLEEEKPAAQSGGGAIYNVFAVLFLILTLVSVGWAVAIFLNPGAAYNPFPPQGPLPTATIFEIPTLTPTFEVTELPPTWTPSVVPTLDGEGGDPPIIEVTPLGGTPGSEEEGTPTPVSTPLPGQPTLAAFPFTLQEGSPEFTQNLEENGGCSYLGVAGQVFDLGGEPLDGIAVVVTGENFETLILTQFTQQFGPGSYQVELNSAPIEAEFEVQLWNVAAQILSDAQVIRTRTTCEENLVFVNFVQNHPF